MDVDFIIYKKKEMNRVKKSHHIISSPIHTHISKKAEWEEDEAYMEAGSVRRCGGPGAPRVVFFSSILCICTTSSFS